MVSTKVEPVAGRPALVRHRLTRTTRITLYTPRTDSLPSTLAIGLRPWISAVETATNGMGEHLFAAAASASAGIRRRIIPTPLLDHALVQARMATDVLASALDERRADIERLRADASAALSELIVWLQEAEPDAVTRELGLGW
ncbi:hypothetical protein MKK65_11260 [Methylobacterium sp. J-001]|uniref:hypothetical protein n=1 Tax=Methylobacterium sp. J-001 TaxID=2836609 RepID=UPI001FBA16FE|nr:hypothetical protein [Methylobacterium sp. J-001]MCJ2117133.1 hypothetical protein [Methylobacterium sp. J-001]